MLPGTSSLRSGSPVTIPRAVSTSDRCPPTERAPRTVTAISEPIADSDTATTVSATSTSISVKPRLPCFFLIDALGLLERNNLDTSRQPVDADLIADAEPRER